MYNKGFVSGMFDPLHAGHIEILKQAKSMCEYLIVAVGTDDFIRNRKKHEPLLPFSDRVKIIESIKYVDCVVPIENLDKVFMYKKYKFDVMFVGSDHKNESVYLQTINELKLYGVDTIFIERIEGVSSTNIKKRMLELELGKPVYKL